MSFMKKYGKMFLGVGIIFITYAIGFIIWSLVSPGFEIDPDLTAPIANTFVAIHFIPAVVFYIIWYVLLANRTPTQKTRAGYNYQFVIPLVAILTFILLFVPSIIFAFISTSIYLLLNTILITIGTSTALFICKPY